MYEEKIQAIKKEEDEARDADNKAKVEYHKNLPQFFRKKAEQDPDSWKKEEEAAYREF